MIANLMRNLVLGLALCSLLVPARAGLVSTGDALDLEAGQPLQTVETWLKREDVAAELAALGVSPEMALERAAMLSEAELEALAGRVESEPAGADIVAVLGITFLVLIILHFTGVLRVFDS